MLQSIQQIYIFFLWKKIKCSMVVSNYRHKLKFNCHYQLQNYYFTLFHMLKSINRRGLPINNLINSIKFSYIKQSDIDLIKDKYQNKTILNQIKIGLQIIKLICVQGFREGKSDIIIFRQLRKIPYEKRTHEQERKFQQIKDDIIKAFPAFCLLNIPFGGPLFFVYLELFPNFVPTWVLLQRNHRKILQIRKDNRTLAYNYFSKIFETNSAEALSSLVANFYVKLKQNAGGNQDLRMILSLLTGHYRDGTYYLTHLSPLNRTQLSMGYFVLPEFSKWLLIDKIESFVRNDTIHREQLKQLSTFPEKLCFQLQMRLLKLQKNQY